MNLLYQTKIKRSQRASIRRHSLLYLYEKLESAREFGAIKPMPQYITDNLNPFFELRPYQVKTFENFITYFEKEDKPRPSQTLFHMATGSGKTLIMAGLMIYLYKKGYRNFLFFVNLGNIVRKTEENFLNSASKKYLFADEIRIDGERVRVNKVENFQHSDNNSINICFDTTAGLHYDMWMQKENSMTFEDFQNDKTVLISDEAHHLNAYTRNALSREEQEDKKTWEQTIETIFSKNPDNVLLEFTATCDTGNPLIKAKYEDKIVYDYPLSKFRADLYSKEIKTLRTDMTIMERCLQACVLSQYRLKVFQDNRLQIKPVILLKADTIANSKTFMQQFIGTIQNLTGQQLQNISENYSDNTMNDVCNYFLAKNISFHELAEELRSDFSEEHCISANEDKDAEKNQILLNSLEDIDNPYRAVFEVKKLDEGWDVLNLFDIVRLYETRQSGGSTISRATVSEAQLIGRGARYCPFKVYDEENKYQRKYDSDLSNPLRICEELFYHCQNDSRYIGELKNALKDIGAEIDNQITLEYILKDEFKHDTLYKDGFVFKNERQKVGRADIKCLLPSIRDKIYPIRIATGSGGEDIILEDENYIENNLHLHTKNIIIGELAKINYAIVHKAIRQFPAFKFNTLQSYFPNILHIREFIISDNYLGKIKMEITSKYEKLPTKIIYTSLIKTLGQISNSILQVEDVYKGTDEFNSHFFREVFKNKNIQIDKIVEGGKGVSQNDNSVGDDRINLINEDWFVFNDNY